MQTKKRPGLRRRMAAMLAATTAALVAVTGLAAAPTAAEAAPQSVSSGVLEWGVKASFRKYIYDFAAFDGKTTLLGSTTQPVAKGEYVWSGGTGAVDAAGSAADVSFGSGNGVHFQSHPMTVGGEKVYALDMTFTNPHVVVTSETEGELRIDAVGYEFKSMTEVGKPYNLKDVAIADLDLSAPTVANGVVTWTDAAATLTEKGSVAFGGYYKPGDQLDPVTFSTAAFASTTAVKFSSSTFKYNVAKKATVTVKSSASSIVPVGKVALKINGKTYSAKLNSKGTASIKLTKPVNSGSRSVSATFTSSNPTAFKGSSGKATVKVTKTTPKVSAKLKKSKVTTKQNAKVAVTVTVPGSLKAKASKAKVYLYDGKKKIKTVKLNSLGKATITVPKLKKGTHKLKVKFAGTSNLNSKTSATRTLKVVK